MVYLQAFRRNLLLKCALQPKIAKKSLKSFLGRGSRSFMVIDVEKAKKLVTSACLYLSAAVFTLYEPIAAK